MFGFFTLLQLGPKTFMAKLLCPKFRVLLLDFYGFYDPMRPMWYTNGHFTSDHKTLLVGLGAKLSFHNFDLFENILEIFSVFLKERDIWK